MSLAIIGEFLTSSIGKYVMIGLALVVWTVYQREQAATKARAECNSEQLSKTLTEVRRQLDVANAALADADKQQTVSDNELAALAKEKDSISAENKSLSTRPCNVPDTAIKRMRVIK